MAALKQQLAGADTVIALITPFSLAGGEVPFQLGAAWSLGKRLILLVVPDAGTSEVYLPMGHAESHVLGPEVLLELAESLARNVGQATVEMGASAREVLASLFPDFSGLDRQSSERLVAEPRDGVSTQPHWPVNESGEVVPPETMPRRELPSCGASLHAGRAVSDCVFHRSAGGRFADELDRPFGGFLAALGTDWNALRGLDDLDVWVEAAENVLAKLGPGEHHVRSFYEVGFQLATLINLANRALEDSGSDVAIAEGWLPAWSALRDAALQASVAAEAVDRLEPMLANLFGPRAERDFANLGRVQECIGEFAGQADAAVLAATG